MANHAGARWYFRVVAGVMLVVVAAGFAPSFYLRPLFTQRPLPGYVIVHGVLLTAWFTLVPIQAFLVATGRRGLHRRLGVLAAGVAALLVPASAFVALRAIRRYAEAHVAPADIQFIVLGDLATLVLFSALVAAAIALRARPDWHRRLLVLACFAILGPAVARLERLGMALPVPVVLLALAASLLGYDLVTRRRPHPATLLGTFALVAVVAAVLALVGTPAAQAAIDALQRRA